MKMRWALAVTFWAAALFANVWPAKAQSAAPAPSALWFDFGQVCVIVACGFAWGDLRASNRERDRRLQRIEKHLFPEDV